ncbi:hemin-degrading factor [Tateyamaria omphalii]|uniref:hemin-degrading factor n=1 Tax=Tateyamaria omphalii TaxID=299262 RepID=UPI0016793376|nr:ChuX/HutX family heme-like substrate-binding protein [Tateyamaria omphalii]GGX37511.1 hemin-degrading factor [Tateyamaria omphalii]
MQDVTLSPEDIRDRRAESPQLRERDFAETLGISEAALVAAYCGMGVTRIDAHPDVIMNAATQLSEVMALTRNASCVHEKVGIYDNYHPGQHAAMILTEDIDLRIFPSYWRHAFMVERDSDSGPRRSIQVFDGAGDAVHKIILRGGSNHDAFKKMTETLASDNQSTKEQFTQRLPAEPAKIAKDKVDVLRKEWRRMTDTHQFLRLVSKLKMNRLGAYRAAGRPFVRKLAPEAVDALLTNLQSSGTEVMLFVGNRGCIQIHTGALHTLRPMSPWQNVMDPGFNLHLRRDHVSEVWAVDKPTQRGTATSVEAFDKNGSLIFQIFGVPKEGRDSRPAFRAIVNGLQEVPA